MQNLHTSPVRTEESQTLDQKSNTVALSFLTGLFFMWGFITCLNDILIPHLKSLFVLSYTQSMLIQFCFFGAYFLVSVPAGSLVAKLGYQRAIIVGLAIAAIGCLIFIPASLFELYPLFLGALFILASGITLLQVAANPLVTLIGLPRTASSRLTMTQAFNSLGTTVAPLIGGFLILNSTDDVESKVTGLSAAGSLIIPYSFLAILLIGLAGIFYWINLPKPKIDNANNVMFSSLLVTLGKPNLLLGCFGIFLYVGAEVSIGSFMINFISLPEIANISESSAAKYVALYWGGAMIGRFIGAVLMQKINAGSLLMLHGICAAALLCLVVFTSGELAFGALLLVGFCNSIMFPTIFSLALRGLGTLTSAGSSLLCFCIAGGAIVPLVQGVVADHFSIQIAFVVPCLCYLFIAYYGKRNFGTSG